MILWCILRLSNIRLDISPRLETASIHCLVPEFFFLWKNTRWARQVTAAGVRDQGYGNAVQPSVTPPALAPSKQAPAWGSLSGSSL